MRNPAFRRRHPPPRLDLALGALAGLGTFACGLASVTGQWLGRPFWWLREERFGSWGFRVARPGRGWISLLVMTFGAALFLRMVLRYRSTRTFRLLLCTVGVCAVVYAGSTLTGGWLGPALWTEREYRHDDGFATGDATGYYDEGRVPRSGWQWISAGVMLGGGAAVVIALRQRSRPDAGPPRARVTH